MRRTSSAAIATLLALAIAAALALTGCDRAPKAVMDSREALGTVVAITAYPAAGADETAVQDGLDSAYEAMARVEKALDAYDPDTAVSAINIAGEGTLTPEALKVFASRDKLGVTEEFSPYLLEVIRLYDFEGTGTVPAAGELHRALVGADGWKLDGEHIRHGDPLAHRMLLDDFPSGLDFGGAAKGLALDDAAAALQGGRVDAALITAGSTTLTFGSKPDGEPWRIGIEDPRDPDAVIATIEATGSATVSTSGDYQRYFEVDGVRYHHILDPRTGQPARGMRSLTVVGAENGLDSDVLSTALFVMGPDKATIYAEENGLGLVIVDDEGRVRIVPGPEDASWEIVETTS